MNSESFARLSEPQLEKVTVHHDKGEPLPIFATPYVWKDPKAIKRRQFLYGHLLVRKFITATIGQGGLGKSNLGIVETLAQVSARPLLGISPPAELRVWLWNLEDPQEETERRIQGAALHYGLTTDDIGDRLFVDSGRDQELVIARTNRQGGAFIVAPVVETRTAFRQGGR
jgi:hypothetical protein